MTPSHVINLTAAWEPAGDRTAGWIRRFGGPSGVTAAHRLWLAIEDADPRVTAILNDRPLPQASVHADDAAGDGRRPTLRWEITGIVASRNTLIIGAPGVLARKPSADELTLVSEALKHHLQRYAVDADAAKKAITFGESRPNPSLPEGELAAYTLAANLLLNLDETVTRN